MRKTKKVPILGANKTTSERYKYVGTTISPHILNFINLYCLSSRDSKSNLLKTLIEEWYHTNENNENIFIETIVERVLLEWGKYIEKHPNASPDKFKSTLQSELMNKGLKMKLISKILTYI